MHELFSRKQILALGGILVVFAIGLVGFYIFSVSYGDGLEVAMDSAGVRESEPVFSGILGYGDNYVASLAMGITGFFITLLVCYLLFRFLRNRDASHDR